MSPSPGSTVAGSEQQPAPLSSGDLPWTVERLSSEVSSLDSSLSRVQWNQVEHLFTSFQGLFSATPGHTTRVQHVIETSLGQVCRTALRPLPRSRWEAVDKEVKDMLQLGVIEPPTAPGAAQYCWSRNPLAVSVSALTSRKSIRWPPSTPTLCHELTFS